MTTLPARKVTEQAAAWYLDYLEGLDEQQERALAQWLRSAPAHAREYAAVAALHGDVVAAARAQTQAVDELERTARADGNVLMLPALPRRQAAPRPRHAARGRRLRRVAVAACAGLLLCAAGGLALHRARQPQGRQYAADAGETRRVVLEDGTWMQLDRGSAVSVRFDGSRRLVEVLRGQALFDIGHGDGRPFLVQAGRALLQDIGTVFDVGVSGTGAAVTVVQGRVFLWHRPASWLGRWRRGGALPAEDGADFLADLRAGQQGRVDGGGRLLSAGPADVDRAVAWLPGDIRFEGETVAEVARRFNAYTSIPLDVEDAALAARRITGVFHARDPEAFLAYLKTLPGVRVLRGDGRVRIVADPAPARARRGGRV
jgi:transmembrane sensor